MGSGVKSELRVRSGCHKCRERRVKCPEQRPICHHCQRLGFVCKYELRLSWQRATIHNSSEYYLSDQRSIRPWMFINVAYGDFSETSNIQKPEVLCKSITSSSSTDLSSAANIPRRGTAVSTGISGSSEFGTTGLRRLLPYYLPEADAYLWDYFDKGMTPQCVLDQSSNPYRNIILRLAIAFPQGPLFHCVLAVAANQLSSLGRTEYLPAMWSHRAHALSRLRGTVGHLCTLESSTNGRIDGALNGDQTVACALMLCFFDISQDCSETWTVHSRFAGNFLFSRSKCTRSLNAEEQALQDFAVTYFVSHDILASTASTTALATCTTANKLCAFADPEALQTLTGCSKELLILISEVNTLGSILDGLDTHGQQPPSGDRMRWRDEIERRLHHLKQQPSPTNKTPPNEESLNISEVKRLAALMYLYARLDRAGPHEPCMVRLTSSILSIIPRISLRTNTVLWPLFITATLGIRPESDEDRKLVLGRLAALQNTRQLGNVKKARHVIESVWKARDLKTSNSRLGWEVLQGRHQTISLA